MNGSHLSLASIRQGFPEPTKDSADHDVRLREMELTSRAYNRRREALVLLAEECASGYTPGAPLHQDYKTHLAGILPWTEDTALWEAFDHLTRLAGQRYDAAQFADAWPSIEANDALVEAEDELRKAAIDMIRSDDQAPRR